MTEIEAPAETTKAAAPTLDAIEARILGCLIEKAATTPEAYPLTLNAMVLACNQKTNREPIMELEPGAVGHTLRQLEEKGLVRINYGARAMRYEHRFDAVWEVTARQRAVLCALLLRGPQTLAELFTRTERLAGFPGMDHVHDTLDQLAARTQPLVIRLSRASGQREDRYMHLLSGPVSVAAAKPAASRDDCVEERAPPELAARIDHLERELAALKAEVDLLRDLLAPRASTDSVAVGARAPD